MVWVIIGCTILIIVCLGGGKRLAQIILGALAIGGIVIFAANAPESLAPSEGAREVPVVSATPVVIAIGAFLLLMVAYLLLKRPSEPDEPG